MAVLSACMSLCNIHAVAEEAEESTGFPGTGVISYMVISCHVDDRN